MECFLSLPEAKHFHTTAEHDTFDSAKSGSTDTSGLRATDLPREEFSFPIK